MAWFEELASMGRKKHKDRRHKKQQVEPKPKKALTKAEQKLNRRQSTKSAGDVDEEGGVQEGSQELEYGVVGLANLRNTCYFNSVLQVLVSSRQLQKYYGDPGHELEAQCGAIALGLRDVFSACKGISKKPGKSQVFRPNRILDALRKVCPAFKAKHQHDAHELMSALIQELVEEEVQKSRQTTKPKDTFVAGKFCGEFGSTLSCQNCSFLKTKKEDFFGISVPIVKFTKDQKGCADRLISADQPQTSLDPPPARSISDGTLGPVVERTDDQCTANLLGGHFKRQVSNEYVSVVINEKGLSLKIVNRVPKSSSEDNINRASTKSKEHTETSSNGESFVNPRAHKAEACSSEAPAEDNETTIKSAILGHSQSNGSSDDICQDAEEAASPCSPETREIDSFESEFTEVRRKGKKGRKGIQKSQTPKLEDLQHGTSNLRTLDECLDEYFSPELVYWRCPKEFPQRHIRISEDGPEVFTVPRKDPCRFMTDCPANRFASLRAKNEPSDSSDDEIAEAEACEQTDGGEIPKDQMSTSPILFPSAKNLKSCLKTTKQPSSPRDRSVNSVKHCKIWTIPDVLLIHLKRFEVNNRGRMTKLNQHIEFDKEIDLAGFCKQDSPDIDNARFALRGVICHSGGLFGGHYVAYVLRSVDAPQWYYVSDHDVQPIKETNVLASQAYILMYERTRTDLDPCEEQTKAGVLPVASDENESDRSMDECDHQDKSGTCADPVLSCSEAADSDVADSASI